MPKNLPLTNPFKLFTCSAAKLYDVDGVTETSGGEVLGSVPVSGTRGIVAAAARQRDTGHNERFYDEQEYERRVKRRRARLIVATEEAFTHIKRLQREPGLPHVQFSFVPHYSQCGGWLDMVLPALVTSTQLSYVESTWYWDW